MRGFNKTIKTLIFSDFLLHSGWGLIGPIFAIFITQQIEGNVAAVGFIAATYWFIKSVTQPFIAHFLDVKRGEKDDFKVLIWGMYLANLVPLGYLFASQLWHVFYWKLSGEYVWLAWFPVGTEFLPDILIKAGKLFPGVFRAPESV